MIKKLSTSFELLDERVRRWVWQQGWSALKDIQENAIPVVLAGNSDVIISASTAGGKTEAAFMPILTSILQSRKTIGYKVLYISPLKALINDQYRRLFDMTKSMDISITPWHGDISASRKTSSLKNPDGIIIITPESLESFLVNRSQLVATIFASLKYVVIDELHAFIGTERGKQLQSLLSRIEQTINRKIPRIAMSATFSDYDIVSQFLRNDGSVLCAIPPEGQSNHEIKVLVKEYIRKQKNNIEALIAEEIYSQLRGSNNLVFANTRGAVEEFSVMLADICEERCVPNEFRAHHGNLSKIERETVEKDLQKGAFPLTVFCTSTLELGVDIGKVKSIAQIGCAPSVSGLRQRLGRSGRRDEPSILRIYSIEGGEDNVLSRLKSRLVQNIAVIELIREHKYEKPSIDSYHFSTLVQQIIAIIVQFGGFYPEEGWIMLCGNGAFRNITPQLFLELLKTLGERGVISQLNTGQIVIGKTGENILKRQDFYVAFSSPIEWNVISQSTGKCIGTIHYRLPDGRNLLLAGKRWIVQGTDEKTFTIYVSPINYGKGFAFIGEEMDIDRLIVEKMREIYLDETTYEYLDEHTKCKEHLEQGRLFFKNSHLKESSFLQHGKEEYFFTWAGSKVNKAIALWAEKFLEKDCHALGLFVEGLTEQDIKKLSLSRKPNAVELADLVPRRDKIVQKYDYLLSDNLLNMEYASTSLDVESAYEIIMAYSKNVR